MDFLQKDYEIPATSRYMKFDEGDNKFRVLGSAITGMEYWKTIDNKRKPFRVHTGVQIAVTELEENPKTGDLEMPKHFWIFPVFNYGDSKVQILEITQKTIQKAIKSYVDNPKWGNPSEYDLTVTKTIDNGKTTYTVMPDPKEQIDEVISKEYAATPMNLNAMYEGKDPFAVEQEVVDPEEVASGIEKARKVAQNLK